MKIVLDDKYEEFYDYEDDYDDEDEAYDAAENYWNDLYDWYGEDKNMTGPMDKLFGHTAFDFNDDGKIDAAEWAFIDEVIINDENTSSDYDDDIDADFWDE